MAQGGEQGSWDRAAAAAQVKPVSVGAAVGLGFLTLGLYPLARFFQAGKAYQRLTPDRPSSFDPLFWSFVGCLALALPATRFLHAPRLLLPLAAVVVGAVLLDEVLGAREEVLRRSGLPRPPLYTPGAHQALWIFGCLTLPIGLGAILLGVQAGLFFADHCAVAHDLARAAVPVPAPATPSYGGRVAGYDRVT